MTLADRGRFCGACRKVVHELARMSERDARALLASPPTEGLCVRYIHDERGEIVFRQSDVIPLARLARRAAAVALAVVLPMTIAACSGGERMMGSPAVPSLPPVPVDTAATMGGVAPPMPAPNPPMPPTPVAKPDGG
jgi:hypothetical protein